MRRFGQSPGKNFRAAEVRQDSVNHADLPSRRGRGRRIRGTRQRERPLAGQHNVKRGIPMAAKAKKLAEEEEETKDAPEDAEQPKATAKKISLKLIIIAAAGFLVVAGGGAGAYMYFGKSEPKKPVQQAEKPAVFVDLPDVLVNLANSGTDRTQYLKVKITLELPDQSLVDKIKPLMPRVMDAFQTYLRELRPTDLDGSAGLYRLKEALTRRVNAAVAPNHITAVLFKEIVVQ